MILSCYVDDRTLAILKQVSRATGRSVEDLAEAAISEVAISAARLSDLQPKGEGSAQPSGLRPGLGNRSNPGPDSTP